MKIPFTDHHLFQVLRRFEQQWLPLDLFLTYYFRAHRALGSKDRQKIAQAAFDMTRWRLLLDHLAGSESSVERRYAIYKGIQPLSFLTVNSIPLHIRLSCPEPLFRYLENDYGEKRAIEIAGFMNTQAPITIRINPLKTTRADLFDKLAAKYAVFPSEKSPYGIHFKERKPFFEMSEFKEGLFEVQDEASQLVALEAQLRPGDLVLDYCSGAGGKSLAFAHLLQGRGQLFLHDVRASALEQAKKRFKRAGIHNAQFTFDRFSLQKMIGKMDWVIIDAPCTGSGTYRRNPDQKWKFSEAYLNELLSKQQAIFQEALPYVKPGGHILYSTCSLIKKENEEQADFFAKTFDLVQEKPYLATPLTLGGMDSFFAATFQKK